MKPKTKTKSNSNISQLVIGRYTVVAKSFVTVKNSILSVHDRSNKDLF